LALALNYRNFRLEVDEDSNTAQYIAHHLLRMSRSAPLVVGSCQGANHFQDLHIPDLQLALGVYHYQNLNIRLSVRR